MVKKDNNLINTNIDLNSSLRQLLKQTNYKDFSETENEILKTIETLAGQEYQKFQDTEIIKLIQDTKNYLLKVQKSYAWELQSMHQQKILHSMRQEIQAAYPDEEIKSFAQKTTVYTQVLNQWKNHVKNKQYGIKILYKYTLNFQIKVNKFLNQEVQTVFVRADGKIFTVKNVLNFFNTIDYDSSTFRTILRTGERSARSQITEFNGISATQEDEQFLQDIIMNWQAHNKKGIFISADDQFLIDNLNTSKWIKVTNVGDIKEAYFAYLIQKTIAPISNKLLYFIKLLSNVDNIAGILKGDVSQIYDNKQIEYAVKSASASLLSYESAIKLAIRILQLAQSGKLTKEAVQQYQTFLINQGSVRNLPSELLQQALDNL